MNDPGMLCLFGFWVKFFPSGHQGVHVHSIVLIPVDQFLESSDPPGSDLPGVHDLLEPMRSTAAQHPDLPRMVVALERPGSEAKSEALPFLEWTLTLPPERRAGIRPLEI